MLVTVESEIPLKTNIRYLGREAKSRGEGDVLTSPIPLSVKSSNELFQPFNLCS